MIENLFFFNPKVDFVFFNTVIGFVRLFVCKLTVVNLGSNTVFVSFYYYWPITKEEERNLTISFV